MERAELQARELSRTSGTNAPIGRETGMLAVAVAAFVYLWLLLEVYLLHRKRVGPRR